MTMAVNWILLIVLLGFHTPVSPESLVIGMISSTTSVPLATNIIAVLKEMSETTELLGNLTLDVRHVTISKTEAMLVPRQVCDLLTSGATVLVSTAPCHLSQLAWGAALVSGVPLVYAGPTPCPDLGEERLGWYNVPLQRACVSDVITDVIVKDKWKDVVIFYDNRHEMYVSELSASLSDHNIETLSINISNRSVSLLTRYREMLQHQDNFIVVCSMMTSSWLLKKARLGNLELLGPKYKWLMPDYGDLNQARMISLLWEGDNVAIVTKARGLADKIQTQINATSLWILDSLNQTLVEEPWSTPNQPCSLPSTWLFGQHFSQVLQNMSSMYMAPSSTPEYTVSSLAVGWYGGLQFSPVGSWTQTSGLRLNPYLFPKEHQGFNNRTFIITTLPYPPFVLKYDNGTYGGICFELVKELARTMNFSYQVVEPEDEVWGIGDHNGKFNGLMGLVQRKEVDFAVGPIGMEQTREAVADFTTPYWGDPTIILMKKPDLATYKIFICVGPFSELVWGLLIISVLATGAFMWLLFWFDPKNDRKVKKKEGIYDPHITMWQTYGALMQQGMVYMPESHSGRVVVAMWWLYVIIMVGTYNGNLIAFLTAPKVDTPVNSLKQLSESKMLFGVMRNAILHGLLEYSAEPDDIYKVLWDKVKDQQASLLVDDPAEGVNRVLDDKNYAFLVEKSYYDTLNNKNHSFSNKSCEFARAKEDFFPTMYGFPFQKGSPYVEQFSIEILKILEAGLMKRWKHKWYSLGNRCTGLERTTAQTNISLAEAQGAFYILGIGLVIATISLSAEKCYECRKRRNSKIHQTQNEASANSVTSSHPGTQTYNTNTTVNMWTPSAFLDSSLFTLPSIMRRKSSNINTLDDIFSHVPHANGSVANGSVANGNVANGVVANGSVANGHVSSRHVEETSNTRKLRNASESVVSQIKAQRGATRKGRGRTSDGSLHRKNAQYRRNKHPGPDGGGRTNDNYSYYEYTPKNKLFHRPGKDAVVLNGHIKKDAETGEYA